MERCAGGSPSAGSVGAPFRLEAFSRLPLPLAGDRPSRRLSHLSARARALARLHRHENRARRRLRRAREFRLALARPDLLDRGRQHDLLYGDRDIGKFALGLWLALLLNHHIPFKSLIRAIVLVPWIVPTVLSAVAFGRILRSAILDHLLHPERRAACKVDEHRFSRHALGGALLADRGEHLARHSLRRHQPARRFADDIPFALRGRDARWGDLGGNASATSPRRC